jgi:hypothetical protein
MTLPWFLHRLPERLGMAWRAFQGDHWQDPKYIAEASEIMAEGAMDAVHDLLDRMGVPRGTFPDDHVANLVVWYNRKCAEIRKLEAALWWKP